MQRYSFKDKFMQKDHYNKQEQSDLQRLKLALAYIKELNEIKYDELSQVEKKIKERVENKTN